MYKDALFSLSYYKKIIKELSNPMFAVVSDKNYIAYNPKCRIKNVAKKYGRFTNKQLITFQKCNIIIRYNDSIEYVTDTPIKRINHNELYIKDKPYSHKDEDLKIRMRYVMDCC